MFESNAPQNNTGPITTATSAADGRLKVGVDTKKKKKSIIKRIIKK